MKKLIACLLLFCSFSLGTSTITASELDGGAEVFIIAPKTGQTICSFELPKGYQPKNGKVEITLKQGKGNVVFTEVFNDLIIALPNNLSGTLYLTIKVDGFIFTKQITL